MPETNFEEVKPRKLKIKSIATELALWLLAPSIGGIAQYLSEQPTAAVRGEEVIKHPEGINLTEEFLEGALPVVAGMIVGKLFYQLGVTKFHAKPDKLVEKYYMIAGGFLGYVSIMALGDIIHQITGVSDVKLLPIK